MAIPVFCCGAECGLAASGHLLTSGTGTIETSAPIRTGSRAFECSNNEFLAVPFAAGIRRVVARIYIRFPSALPNVDKELIAAGSCGAVFDASEAKIYADVDGTRGASGISVVADTWYRLELDVNRTADPGLANVMVDGSACGQASKALAAGDIPSFIMGGNTSFTGSLRFDDLIISHTGTDYPLGAGHVISSIPNADGTHNVAGANDFEFADGTDITNATTTAHAVIARRPLNTSESADYIEGTAPPNASDYVEWQYENATGETEAPRAVEAIVAVTDSGGAGTCNYSVTLRDSGGGTSADIRAAGTQNTGSTVLYPRAHFATIPGGGAWTLEAFNALRSRFLVSDASPDPRINAAMLEAEFVDPFMAGPAPYIMSQAVNRAATF